jgi:hypothetical protein
MKKKLVLSLLCTAAIAGSVFGHGLKVKYQRPYDKKQRTNEKIKVKCGSEKLIGTYTQSVVLEPGDESAKLGAKNRLIKWVKIYVKENGEWKKIGTIKGRALTPLHQHTRWTDRHIKITVGKSGIGTIVSQKDISGDWKQNPIGEAVGFSR